MTLLDQQHTACTMVQAWGQDARKEALRMGKSTARWEGRDNSGIEKRASDQEKGIKWNRWQVVIEVKLERIQADRGVLEIDVEKKEKEIQEWERKIWAIRGQDIREGRTKSNMVKRRHGQEGIRKVKDKKKTRPQQDKWDMEEGLWRRVRMSWWWRLQRKTQGVKGAELGR